MNKSSAKINYLYSIAYQILSIVVPLITAPYITRKLGAEMIGKQSYCYSIATYFVYFVMLGVLNYGNRSVAKVRDDRSQLSKEFWTIYDFQLLRGLFVLFCYCLYIYIFSPKYIVIAALNGIYVFSSILDINWLFWGLEQFKITVVRNSVIKLINTICIFVFIKSPDDLWKYALLIVTTSLFSNILLWLYVRKFVDFYKPKLKELLPHIKPELFLFVPVIAVSLYKVMDRIMIGYFSTDNELGFYTQSENVVNIPLGLITALGNVMLPKVSNLYAKGKLQEMKKYMKMSLSFVMMLSFALMFGLSAIAPTFAPVFWGEEFTSCSTLLIGLSITIIFISWANVVRTQYLIPCSKDRIYIISILMGAIINIIVNLLLIPHIGANGAVIGTICAEATVCISQTAMISKQLPIINYIKNSVPFFFLGIAMYVVVSSLSRYLSISIISLIIEIIVGGGMYLLLLLFYSKISNSYSSEIINSMISQAKNKVKNIAKITNKSQ